VSKFNLSDIFEYMSPVSFESALDEIVRVSRHRARLAYWTLFLPRSVPEPLNDRIEDIEAQSQELFRHDRTFFYGSFHLWHCQSAPLSNGSPEIPLARALLFTGLETQRIS
jgi:S-adenosylmethionine-diacylglycerol 3-amino-3-carboxypropyl transferase